MSARPRLSAAHHKRARCAVLVRSVTVYELGAEVVRMISTIVGQQAFRAGKRLHAFSYYLSWFAEHGENPGGSVYREGAAAAAIKLTRPRACPLCAAPQGLDLYFARHDGSAVTCEDFVLAMEDASGKDLGQFRRWYSKSGTPTVVVNHSVLDDGSVELRCSQTGSEQPLDIPVLVRGQHTIPHRQIGQRSPVVCARQRV